MELFGVEAIRRLPFGGGVAPGEDALRTSPIGPANSPSAALMTGAPSPWASCARRRVRRKSQDSRASSSISTIASPSYGTEAPGEETWTFCQGHFFALLTPQVYWGFCAFAPGVAWAGVFLYASS
jgi:hypothetical protein